MIFVLEIVSQKQQFSCKAPVVYSIHIVKPMIIVLMVTVPGILLQTLIHRENLRQVIEQNIVSYCVQHGQIL
jgi:hypothetical protein